MIKYWCTPYPVIYGVGELNAIEYVDRDQVQTKCMRRHREDTRETSAGHSFTNEGIIPVVFLVVVSCYAATQLALQLQQERTQVVCSTRVARKRPARRHSRNSCHVFVCIVVCACSRHALDFKRLFLTSFVSRKGFFFFFGFRPLRDLFYVEVSHGQNYPSESETQFGFSRESDWGALNACLEPT